MPWWPGWDSIESTDFWNSFYFWFGIICLFLLGISEVISHYYGERHSDLLTAAESRAVTQRQNDQQKADERHRSEMAEVQRQLKEARREQAPRRINSEQRNALIAALSPFPGQKIETVCILGDTEGQQLASDFITIFQAAKWDFGSRAGINQAAYTLNPTGIEISVKEATPNRVPPPLAALVAALADLRLIPGRNITVDAQVPEGTIKLTVGTKPSSN